MPKIRLEDEKHFKIERKVFDQRTLMAIYKLLNKGTLKTVESFANEGKESAVLSAKSASDEWLAVKIYRTKYCDFKTMWQYLAGDQRFAGIKKNRLAVVFNWCRREFKNLKIAYKAGVSCPEPIDFKENVLVIGFIGEDGKLAPRLIDLTFSKEDARIVYEDLIVQIKKLYAAGLVHTDLSAYNILFFDKLYMIDFSQAVQLNHPRAAEFLIRDIKNISSYFKKFGVQTEDEQELAEKIARCKK